MIRLVNDVARSSCNPPMLTIADIPTMLSGQSLRAEPIPMSIDRLKERLPDYAKDLRVNLGVITSSTMLTAQQAWGTALAAAIAARNAEVVAAIAADAKLSPDAAATARSAAAVMGMNSIFY